MIDITIRIPAEIAGRCRRCGTCYSPTTLIADGPHTLRRYHCPECMHAWQVDEHGKLRPIKGGPP